MAAEGGVVLWLHGSRGTGEESRAKIEPYFSAVELASLLRFSFPTAPAAPVACYGGEVITAWFGISEVPITSSTVRDEKEVLKAVEHVHEMLNKEVAAGTSPTNIFVCGLSQGGALAIASVLLYPKALGGCVVFSGSVPLSQSFAERVPSEARKTPVLWFHGMADGLVLFEAGHARCISTRAWHDLRIQGGSETCQKSLSKCISFKFSHLPTICKWVFILQDWSFDLSFSAYVFSSFFSRTCYRTYPTLGHSLVDEELQYFRRWILDRLGISQGPESSRPSSS